MLSSFRCSVLTGPATRVHFHASIAIALSVIALTEGAQLPATEVFERARRSVVLVETESGHGTGFLVDSRGLILTNDHVVKDSSYLAVSVDPERKYPAIVVARDSSRDLAVIRIHPDAVRGVQPLTSGSSAAVRVGDSVMAIGSTFSGVGAVLTMGRVSMVSGEKIMADLNVNSGTSGGPLLNERGEVIGVCTFWKRAPAGPGLAGVIPIEAARPIMAEAFSLSGQPPPLERLPVASAVSYPVDLLRERVGAIQDAREYGTTIAGGRIDVLTPPAVYFEAHQQEILDARMHGGQKGSQQRYAWHAHTGEVEAIVGVRVRLRRSFVRMRLLRNGAEVTPIVPGRLCSSRPSKAPSREECLGLYQYRPEAFAPGADLQVHVYLEDAPAKPHVWKLPPGLVRLVWCDFELTAHCSRD